MTYCSSSSGALLQRTARNIQSGPGSMSQRLETKFYSPAAAKLRDISRNRVTAAIMRLAALPRDWDGADSLPAHEISVAEAIDAVGFFIEICGEKSLDWFDPWVGLDSDGAVVFEWWSSNRRLTIYLTPGAPSFVSSWGSNIEAEMDAGLFERQNFANLWRWLICQHA